MEKVLPNFLIVGAAKAGTTSLYEYLRQHPGIFMPANAEWKKEPAYFVHGYGVNDFQKYLTLFKEGAGKKAIGEASSAYLYCEESPRWIKLVLGAIKIIIILRNPAQRAFSLYTWMAREGYENAKTFAEALGKESLRLDDPYFHHHCPEHLPNYLYFSSGLYFEQVKRYWEVFGKDRVRVFLFEDLVNNPIAVCRTVFEFLSVDSSFVPIIKVHNEGRLPCSIALQSWLRSKGWASLMPISSEYQRLLLEKAMNLNARFGRKPKIARELCNFLKERFEADIIKLEELLGRDLSSWYAKST